MSTFWKDFPQYTVLAFGDYADRPTTPDSVHHSYLATDRNPPELYVAVDTGSGGRVWRQVGSGGGFYANTNHVTTSQSYTIAADTNVVIAGGLLVDGSLTVSGTLKEV